MKLNDIMEVCPVCGKEFIKNTQSIYKTKIRNKVRYMCGYTCYRAMQKQQESKKRHKRRESGY